ncbi:MAG: ATP-binding protein [Verrucomicrobiota bacterium]
MKTSRRASLALRIIVLTLFVGVVFSALGVGLELWQFERSVKKTAHRETSTIAQAIALTAESVDDLDTLQRYVLMVAANPFLEDIHIVSGKAKEIIASSKYRIIGRPVEALPRLEEKTAALHILKHMDIHASMQKEDSVYEVVLPARIFGGRNATYLEPAAVLVSMDYSHIQAAYREQLIYKAALLILLVLCSAVTASIFIIRKVLSPLSRLKNKMREEAHLIGMEEMEVLRTEDEVQSLIRVHHHYAKSLEEKQRALNIALEQAEELAQISMRTSNAVVICGPNGRIQWINPSFEKLTGYTLDEVAGKTPGRLLQGKNTDPETVEKIGKALKANKPITTNLLNYHKSGRPYWVRLDIEPLFSPTGQLQKYIAIESDVSLEKQRETEMVRAKEAAEALAQAKTDFLATMSHEIRTPMNGVVGMLELLHTTELNKEQKEFLQAASNSSDTMITLINDILDFTKMESVGIHLEQKEFSLEDEIEKLWNITQEAARNKGLEYRSDIAEGVPNQLIGDPMRLRQLLTNLASNAIKFTSQGHVVVKIQYHGVRNNQHQLEFSVTDSGIGIDDETQKRLFTPFTQAESSTSREYGGTGLGLAICKQICEAMGSKIYLRSSPGKGSEFKVVLPFQQVGAGTTKEKPVNSVKSLFASRPGST